MNEQRRGTYTQWNVTQPQEKNEIMPFTAIWMDLETIISVKYIRERRTNIMISLICGTQNMI